MRRPWYKGFLPGWIVSGGGGGLSSVATNTTLTGNGTGGSPLGVSGIPLTFWQLGTANAFAAAITTANTLDYYGFSLPSQITITHLSFLISTLDAVNLYDFGIYNPAGTLLANIGARSLPSTGIRTFAIVQASVTLNPGLYVVAATGNANTAKIAGDTGPGTWVKANAIGSSSAGALPASITAPVTSLTNGLMSCLFN